MTDHHHHDRTGAAVYGHDDESWRLYLDDTSLPCYDDHDLSFWQQFREVLRELWAELQPEAIAARLDAWVERQQR